MIRVDEPFRADERTTLDGWLAWQRATLLHKCAGLSAEQLAQRSVPPSELSLLGLIRHHVDVERTWVRRRLGREDIAPAYHDGVGTTAWSGADPQTAEADYRALLAEWEACDRVLAEHSLEDTLVSERHGEMSCRWMILHLIEEYARHNGHADLLRERIDGRTGT